VSARASVGGKDVDHPAHAPVLRAAPQVAVEGVDAWPVYGERDLFCLARCNHAEIESQAGADRHSVSDILRMETEPHRLSGLNAQAGGRETALFGGGHDNVDRMSLPAGGAFPQI
jgi:hypothetical protein